VIPLHLQLLRSLLFRQNQRLQLADLFDGGTELNLQLRTLFTQVSLRFRQGIPIRNDLGKTRFQITNA